MALLLKDLRLSLSCDERECIRAAAQRLKVPEPEIRLARFVRLSLDARRKSDIHYTCTLRIQLNSEADEAKLIKYADASVCEEIVQKAQSCKHGDTRLPHRPVVVGAGPCGMFAALLLAREGYRPVVIERGAAVERRVPDVEAFWSTGALDGESNVLFGEGGAGTFSDGKLTTRIKDPRSQQVLRILVEMGAPEEIEYLAKPHIGTDRLRAVVANIRREVERLGGEYRFGTRLCGFLSADGALRAIEVNDGEKRSIETAVCVLAIGHSARDTYELLQRERFSLSAKPFAVGVRIEHPQRMIDEAQYGALAGDPRLGAADYQLTARAGERGVYTFCMCPGGEVVASASEPGGVVTNGMSYHARSGKNANAALIVQVSPADYGGHPLDGVRFQREIERAAFLAGGGGFAAPAQRVADFLQKRASTRFGAVEPSYRPGVTSADLRTVLPGFVAGGIAQALPQMGRLLKGFDSGDAVLTGVETRSSAPLRIERDERHQAPGLRGVYPGGEGAGYAGGIVSAAVDGLRIAQLIVETFSEQGLS